jgi:hypothetical protein
MDPGRACGGAGAGPNETVDGQTVGAGAAVFRAQADLGTGDLRTVPGDEVQGGAQTLYTMEKQELQTCRLSQGAPRRVSSVRGSPEGSTAGSVGRCRRTSVRNTTRRRQSHALSLVIGPQDRPHGQYSWASGRAGIVHGMALSLLDRCASSRALCAHKWKMCNGERSPSP